MAGQRAMPSAHTRTHSSYANDLLRLNNQSSVSCADCKYITEKYNRVRSTPNQVTNFIVVAVYDPAIAFESLSPDHERLDLKRLSNPAPSGVHLTQHEEFEAAERFFVPELFCLIQGSQQPKFAERNENCLA